MKNSQQNNRPKENNGSNQREKPGQYDKYYAYRADFTYMKFFNYKVISEIGRGGYGVVYKANRIQKKEDSNVNEFAIKINFKTVSRQLIYAEMGYLQLVKNKPNLPKMVNLFIYKDITHIVLEYFKYKPFIAFFTTFKIQDVKHYVFQMLIALKSMKDIGIYHRDVKPGNFLYNPETKRGVILDFGLAQIDPRYPLSLTQQVKQLKDQGKQQSEQCKKLQETVKIYRRLVEGLKIIGRNKIGTESYMPLQSILYHNSQSYSTDIWPVGVTILQFVTRKYTIFNNVRMINKPTTIKNSYYINFILQLVTFFGQDVVEEVKRMGYDIVLPKDALNRKIQSFKDISNLEGFDDTLNDLIYKIMKMNPQERISVEDALAHPFFDTVRQEHMKMLSDQAKQRGLDADKFVFDLNSKQKQLGRGAIEQLEIFQGEKQDIQISKLKEQQEEDLNKSLLKKQQKLQPTD